VALFSSLGLPGLNGFVGEFLIFKGVFPLAPWAATFSLLGLLLTAIFLLAIMQRVFSGPVGSGSHGVADLTRRERWLLAPAIGLMFLLGFFPQLLVGLFNGTASRLAQALVP
jgi:NADH-quinone oxidoreductase subunit M